MDLTWLLRLGGPRRHRLVYLDQDPTSWPLGRRVWAGLSPMRWQSCSGGLAANCGSTERSLRGFLSPDPVVTFVGEMKSMNGGLMQRVWLCSGDSGILAHRM